MLYRMALAKDKNEWGRTALVCAVIANSNRTGDTIPVERFNPYSPKPKQRNRYEEMRNRIHASAGSLTNE